MSLSEAGSSTPAETEDNSLIPGLPDDVSLCCIARVPRRYHDDLVRVSKGWRDLVLSEEWLEYRKKHGLQETWIYALCIGEVWNAYCYVLDPSADNMCWKLTPFTVNRGAWTVGFGVLGKKLYIVGGKYQEDSYDHTTGEVNFFDASTNIVGRAASLTFPRRYHICEAFNGKIYAIGGHSIQSGRGGPLPSEVYDPHTNIWTSLSDPNIFECMHYSTVVDGRIYVRGSACQPTTRSMEGCYDPSSNRWHVAVPDLASNWTGFDVVIDGTLYILHLRIRECRKWDKEKRDWVMVGKLPNAGMIALNPVAIGKTVYVVGSNLSMLILYLDRAPGNKESMVPYTFIKNSNRHIAAVSCRCLAL